MARVIKVKFRNGKTASLTKGEVAAIEKMARMNGTSPERPQYDPGNVKYNTLNNLIYKGVLCRKGGIHLFLPGLLDVQGPSLYSGEPFTLDPYIDAATDD